MAVALNSGFVARPTGYTRAGSAAGLTLWLPDTPEGYAALGCVAAPGSEPPPTAAGACVHRDALVEAPLGEFLLLKQARTHMRDVLQVQGAELAPKKQPVFGKPSEACDDPGGVCLL